MNNYSIETIKSIVRKSIRRGFNDVQIKSFLRTHKDAKNLKTDVISEVVDDVISDFPNYGLIQKVVRSKIICDFSAEDQNYRILDDEHRDITVINRARLSEIFDPKYELKSKAYTAKYEYRPLDAGTLLKNADGTYTYNTYVPPEWQEDWFYSHCFPLWSSGIHVKP